MRARKAMPFALAALSTAVILTLVLVSPGGRSYTLDSVFFCPNDLENGRHARLGFEWGHFVRPIDANPTLWKRLSRYTVYGTIEFRDCASSGLVSPTAS